MLHASENQTRILARIVREALRAESFDTLADLTADVKTRCARLRLRLTADDLNAAYALIASNTPLLWSRVHVPAPVSEPVPLSTADARAALLEASARTGMAVRIKGIRTLSTVKRTELLDLLTAIKVATLRCDLLEHEDPKDGEC